MIVSRVLSRRKRFHAFPQPGSVPRKWPFPESFRVFPCPSVYPLWRQNLFSHYATLNRFWLLWILFWLCNWTVVISIQIIIIQMVSWPTKRFLLFYVTWCHFVYFTFWVTYQPISLPPHDNKNLFPPHWFQHQDTHFSSLFTPSQHWWNLRVSDEIFVFSFCSELWSILYLKYIYNFIIDLAFFHVLHIFFNR